MSLRAKIKLKARRSVAALGTLSSSTTAQSAPHALTYHRIAPAWPLEDSSWVCHDAFVRQMRFLADTCRCVPPSELTHAELDPAGRSIVCITIDDGHISALELAAPILVEHGLHAALFIPTDYIGRRNQLSRGHIRDLADAGFTIGSHGCSHRSLRGLSPEDRVRDAFESKWVLEDITGSEVTSFAYPYGTRRDFGPCTDQVLAEAGYRIAFTSQHGPVTRRTHPLRVPRVKIEGTDTAILFSRIVAGHLDAWSLVDRWLWWLQRGPHRRGPTADVQGVETT